MLKMTDNDEHKYAIILAAGKGKRMKSNIPKVLHKLSGKCLIDWVIESLVPLKLTKIAIVVGFMREKVIEHIESMWKNLNIEYIVQEELLGTADAVKCALPVLPEKGNTFVLCGDVPLITTKTLEKLLDFHISQKASATILTAIVPNPFGYGRILRNSDGSVKSIVEQRDATDEQLEIREINSGAYIFRLEDLCPIIDEIDNKNSQGEYYLTDAIRILIEEGKKVSAITIDNFWEIEGINSIEQLNKLEHEIINIRNNNLI